MRANGIRTARVKTAVLAMFAALLMAVALAPAGADAAKVDNPSPPNFKAEVTGGFLQFLGSTGTPLQLPLDFSTLDPPLPNPTLTGSITTNANRYGVINVPQAGISFPPIPVDTGGFSITIRLLPVGAATGFIDPLGGRVDLNIPIRLKAEGAALGQNLGDNCYVGSVGTPINLSTTTSNGTFPVTNPPPDQTAYVADFVSDGGSFAGGWLAAQPYTDEAGVWPTQPAIVPGKPVGTLPKPTVAEIPYNPLTDFVTRAAGTWRGMNETLAAPAAQGCGTGILAGTINGQVNTAIGLPSVAGASSASLDFKFVSFADRSGSNAIVNKAVKSRFTAPGISASPWLGTQVPTAVSAQNVSIDASTSYFKVGGNPTERYAFDLGTGSFGAWSTNPVASFTAPTLSEGAPPVNRVIRVRVKDTDGDVDISTRTLKVVPATDIAVDSEASSLAGANFRAGSSGHVMFHVTNRSATDASSQVVNFNASLPSGVSLTNLNSPAAWTCNTTPSTIACSIPQNGLAANEVDDFDATVDVATGTANPASVNATVAMAGDPAPANDAKNLAVPVVKTDLAVSLTRTSPLVANGWTPYEISVANVGDGLTVGGSTVNLALPPDFSYRSIGSGGTGWSCTTPVDNRNIVCQRSAELNGNSTAPLLTLVAKIDRTAAAGASTVNASVTTQGDVDAFGGSNSDDDTSNVSVLPDMTVDVSVAGNYNVGDPGQATFVATNEAVVSINGPSTVTSTLPAGITVTSVSGAGWDCSATTPGSSAISCDFAAGLNANESTSPLTANFAVAQAAFPGVTIATTVANAEDGFALNNDDSAVVEVRRLDVAIQKLAVKPFNVGIEGRYRLNVTNVGTSPTLGSVTVVDDLPTGLKLKAVSGAGWNCGASQIGQVHVECVLVATLGPGVQAAPIEVKVDVLDAAAQAGTVVNTAYVDTIRDTRGVLADAAITDNNTSTSSTTAVAVDLSIDSTHPGDFRVGTDDVYSLTARNVGFFGTDPGESVTVTDELPDGIVPIIADIDISRPGWTCVDSSGDVVCTLPAPSPITSAMEPESAVTFDIPVQVTDAAADDSTNVALISTARDSNPVLSPNNRFEDATHVNRIDLRLAAQETIVPRAGGIGEVNVDVTNIGSAATTDPAIVTIPLAPNTAYRPTGSKTVGWQCSSPGAGTQVTCVRSPIIAAGGTAPELKIRSNVGASAPATWSTAITLSTIGEPSTRLTDNSVSVGHTLEKIDLNVTRTHEPTASRAGKRSSSLVEVKNLGNTASTGTIRVEDPVSSSFTNVSASGPGWSCSVTGNSVVCTRTASLPAGASAPLITVGYNIPANVAGTRDWTTTVSNPSDPYPANNTDTDAVQVVASADVAVSIDQPASMKVGDSVDVTYTVRNIGTESTSGQPSVKVRIGTSSGLDPVSADSTDDWDCTAVSASGPDAAFFDCSLGDELAPGAISSLVGNFDVIPTPDSQTATLVRATTAGDINFANDLATATSNLSGLDLRASVAIAAPPNNKQDLTAGETGRRVVTVTNDGTSATNSPIKLRVPLPTGVQWDSAATGAGGSGWSCSLISQVINCVRNNVNDSLAAGASLPPVNIDLRPSRSNASSITVNYVASTLGDENAGNDAATRVDTVLYYPETNITSAPSGSVTTKSASIAFDSDDNAATFECKVDNGVFAACTSPLALSSLNIGVHSVTVKARNANSMYDATPAAASWTVINQAQTGPSKGIKAKLTGGSLSLASLGAVPLPADQLTLQGRRYTDNGALVVPATGVDFKPVTQTIPDVLGPGSNVDVVISISATGDGVGTLPAGGGPASFVLPVRADVQARLGAISVIPAGTECALKPVTFDLAGTYNEGAKTVSLSSSNVGFPQVTGCDAFKGTIDSLLELPRNDISISLDFSLEDIADQVPCPAGTTGDFEPNCTPIPPAVGPVLSKPTVKGPKVIKSGKKFSLKLNFKNTGDTAASNVKVCLSSPKKYVKGSGKRCKTVASIAAGGSSTSTFKYTAKQGKTGSTKRVTFTATGTYSDSSGTVKTVTQVYKARTGKTGKAK